MSVIISKNPKDEVTCLTLHFRHPLVTLDEKTDDDVVFVHFPPEMLESFIPVLQASLDKGEGQKTMFTADIKLRHGVVVKS